MVISGIQDFSGADDNVAKEKVIEPRGVTIWQEGWGLAFNRQAPSPGGTFSGGFWKRQVPAEDSSGIPAHVLDQKL